MVSSKAPKKATGSSQSTTDILSTLWRNYTSTTSPKLKLIDTFMAFFVCLGVLQFSYCLFITSFPFNAFLAGFAATVGQFVLLAALRIQSNPENKPLFKSISQERAFADFIFASVVLHFFVFNLMG